MEKLLQASGEIVVVQSLWHSDFTDLMVHYCNTKLLKAGLSENQIRLLHVPGALEIPVMAKLAIKKYSPRALICFGAIIRGETYHFEMVANAVNDGMNRLAYEFELPVIQQVLAVNSLAELAARAGADNSNKGIEAAQAVVSMLNQITRI